MDTEIPVSGPFNLVNGKVWPTKKGQGPLVSSADSQCLQHPHAHARRTRHDRRIRAAELPANNTDTSNGFVPARVTPMTVIGTDGGLLRPLIPVSTPRSVGRTKRRPDRLPVAGGKTLELRNEQNAFINADQGRADATIMQFVVGKTARPPTPTGNHP